MSNSQSAFYIFAGNPFTWRADWIPGVSLILLAVLFHVSGLLVIDERVVHGYGRHMIEAHSGAIGAFWSNAEDQNSR